VSLLDSRLTSKQPTPEPLIQLCSQSVDQQNKESDNYCNYQDAKYQLDISIVSPPWPPRPHIFPFSLKPEIMVIHTLYEYAGSCNI